VLSRLPVFFWTAFHEEHHGSQPVGDLFSSPAQRCRLLPPNGGQEQPVSSFPPAQRARRLESRRLFQFLSFSKHSGLPLPRRGMVCVSSGRTGPFFPCGRATRTVLSSPLPDNPRTSTPYFYRPQRRSPACPFLPAGDQWSAANLPSWKRDPSSAPNRGRPGRRPPFFFRPAAAFSFPLLLTGPPRPSTRGPFFFCSRFAFSRPANLRQKVRRFLTILP